MFYRSLPAAFFFFAVALEVTAPPLHARCNQLVYIIAHRCNGTEDVSEVVALQGVNAIEADFSYGSPTIFANDRWVVDHDGVFAWSTDLGEWLDDVAKASDTLSLVIFDIKDPDGPLLELYNKARGKLGPDINLIFSIGDFSSRNEFGKIAAALNNDPRAGAAIDFLVDDETQEDVEEFFFDEGIKRYWFGDGFNAATPTPPSVVQNVLDGFELRDAGGVCDSFHGVYTWTYEREPVIKAFLDAGINGIFINAAECFGRINPAGAWPPADVVAYARTLTTRNFATRADNPFQFVRPEITCPGNVTVECSAEGGVFGGDSILSDFLDGATVQANSCDAVTDYHDAPFFFVLGNTTDVEFTVSDAGTCNPSSSCVASVTVVDTTAPALALLGGRVTIECAQGSYSEPGADVVDVCDPAARPVIDSSRVNPFEAGTYQVRYNATDSSGNAATELTRLVNVEDTIAPTISLVGGARVLECNVDRYTELGATVSDFCDPSVVVQIGGDTVNPSVVGSYAITYDASDASGNFATQRVRTVTVRDSIVPSIACPADIAVEPVSPTGTVVSFAATGSDICDPSPVLECPSSGNTFPVGTDTVVECHATDASQNRQSCSLKITVFSPEQVVNNLQEDVAGLALDHGQSTSIQSNLRNILRSIDRGNSAAACGQLRGFISHIGEKIEDGTLTPLQGQALIQSAENLRATLGCSNL